MGEKYRNQAEKRGFLIKRLLDEGRRYRGMEVPADAYEQKRMLRSLPAQERPHPVSGAGRRREYPGIIKVPFLRMTAQNPKATYVCINLGEAVTMSGLEAQSILLDADIGAVLSGLRT